MNYLFTEKQWFNQTWLWAILIIVNLIPVYGIYKQMVLGEPFGNNPMSNSGLFLLLFPLLGSLVFFRLLQLSTTITKEQINIRFFPFTNKTIKWNEVKSAEVINYGFVGGWGIRMGTKYGTVYNIRRDKGLFLQLKNGKKLCVGTQREEELRDVLNNIFT